MLDNPINFTNDKKTGDNRNMFQQKNTENYVDVVSKQRGRLKENLNKRKTYIQNQKEAAEISCTDNAEGVLGKINSEGPT